MLGKQNESIFDRNWLALLYFVCVCLSNKIFFLTSLAFILYFGPTGAEQSELLGQNHLTYNAGQNACVQAAF